MIDHGKWYMSKRRDIMRQLYEAGVSPWMDNLHRTMLRDGSLRRAIEEDGVLGMTSNPSIFQAAIAKSNAYDEDIAQLAKEGLDAEAIVWKLMVQDMRSACAEFILTYEQTICENGFVSLELDPTKADDTEASIAQALELYNEINMPNLMIKVPATPAGYPVITALLAEGINVNVTLLFSIKQYEAAIEAWFDGMEKRLIKQLENRFVPGLFIDRTYSVASFFISRIDTEVDARIDAKIAENPSLAEKLSKFRGQIGLANARVAYDVLRRQVLWNKRWKLLAGAEASVQRLLWASTGTKNPAYSDTLYVDGLIGPHCVNTMPNETLAAFMDHGHVSETLTIEKIQEARNLLREFAEAGFDLNDITENTLLPQGLEKFAKAYRDLVAAVKAKMA